MYLLDTNIVIYYLEAALPPKAMRFVRKIVDEQPILSVINKIELLGFNAPNKEEQAFTELFVQEAKIIDFDKEIVEQTIIIRKQNRIKLPDAIIAATAIVYNLPCLPATLPILPRYPTYY